MPSHRNQTSSKRRLSLSLSLSYSLSAKQLQPFFLHWSYDCSFLWVFGSIVFGWVFGSIVGPTNKMSRNSYKLFSLYEFLSLSLSYSLSAANSCSSFSETAASCRRHNSADFPSLLSPPPPPSTLHPVNKLQKFAHCALNQYLARIKNQFLL